MGEQKLKNMAVVAPLSASLFVFAMAGCAQPLSTQESCTQFKVFMSTGDLMTREDKDQAVQKFKDLAGKASDAVRDDVKVYADYYEQVVKG